MTTLTIQVAASADDCLKRESDDAFLLAHTEQLIGYVSASLWGYGAGFRFLNVTVPVNSTIISAYLSVCASAAYTVDNFKSRIRAEAADNPATFSTVGDFDARTWTTAAVSWDTDDDFALNTWYNSPDIKTAIQEVVDRAGWASGNAMVVSWEDWQNRCEPAAAARAIYNWDMDSTKAAKLIVSYRDKQSVGQGTVSIAGALATFLAFVPQVVGQGVVTFKGLVTKKTTLPLWQTSFKGGSITGNPTADLADAASRWEHPLSRLRRIRRGK